MRNYQEILEILEKEYPDLLKGWINYCEFQEWDTDIFWLKLWLEKRHKDFIILFNSEDLL